MTKIVGATLGLAMAIGVSAGFAFKSMKPVVADVAEELAFHFNGNDVHGSETGYAAREADCDSASTSKVSSAHWQITVGNNSAQLGTNAKAGNLSKTTLGNGGFSAASGLASALSIETDTQKYSAAICTTGMQNITKGQLFFTGTNGGAITTAWLLSSTDGTSWAIESSKTSSIVTESVFSVTKSSNAKQFAFVAYWNLTNSGGLKGFEFKLFGEYEQAANTHRVTFVPNNGEESSASYVADGATVSEPANPVKNGYTFIGWYDNEECMGDSYDFDTAVNAPLTLYAKWEKVALTATYSASTLTNGTGYRITGEITARIAADTFFIQDGNNAMMIYDSTYTSSYAVGNVVDLYGTYASTNTYAEIKDLVYATRTSEDTVNSQTPLTSLNDVTEANRFKYIEIPKIQLSTAFNSNNNASIKNSSVVIYVKNPTYVNGGTFNKTNYAANDYVSVKGVVSKYNSTIQLQIVEIQKLAQYTVTFHANAATGVSETPSQSVLVGDKAIRPENPTRQSDESYIYTFVDWYLNEAGTGEPYDFDTPITGALDLYAKWNVTNRPAKDIVENLSTQSSLTYHYAKDGNGVLDALDKSFTGISGNSYSDWDDKTGASGVVYAGNSYGASSYIQLNSNTTYKPGIVVTNNDTAHNAKKITIKWSSTTTVDRSVQIYGKDEAYSSTADLYNDSDKGDLLATLSKNQNNDNSVYEFESDYKYIGIKATGALYIEELDVQWGVLPTYTYSKVGIRFIGSIAPALWDQLNSESTIEGYGIMYATAQYLNGDSIKDLYDLARALEENVDAVFQTVDGKSYKTVADTEIKSFYTPLTQEKTHPTEAGGNYIWNLFKDVDGTSDAELTKSYTAIAFIRTTNDEIVFLEDTTKSAAQLAQDYIDADNGCDGTYLEGSLGNLAGKLA